jgi:hypothetical protein
MKLSRCLLDGLPASDYFASDYFPLPALTISLTNPEAMALAQKKQPLIGSAIAATLVFACIILEEIWGTVPDAVFGGVAKHQAYLLALIVVPFFGAVFSRAPDDLEKGVDHLLHSATVVLVLGGIALFVALGGLSIEGQAYLARVGFVGIVIGWAFHVLQDKLL